MKCLCVNLKKITKFAKFLREKQIQRLSILNNQQNSNITLNYF